MYCWSKEVPCEEADAWETRLALAEVFASLVHIPGEPVVRLEVYTENEAQAEVMEQRWDGAVSECGSEDWVRLSQEKSRGKHLMIGARFLVSLDDRAEFLEELRRREPERELLVYPPDVAFGTGDHETTTTCLEFLQQWVAARGEGSSWSVLDLGCGTGILGTAAARLGADPVTGLDCDARAVAVAEKCWAANGSPGQDVTWSLADVHNWAPAMRYDLVFANIFSDVLIALMPTIRESVSETGAVILSGIKMDQADEVVGAAEKAGLSLVERATVGQWTTLRLRPSQD